MTQVLTEKERLNLYRDWWYAAPEASGADFVRAIESAVLAKLAQQEPVAGMFVSPMVRTAIPLDVERWRNLPHGAKLYAHPSHADLRRLVDEVARHVREIFWPDGVIPDQQKDKLIAKVFGDAIGRLAATPDQRAELTDEQIDAAIYSEVGFKIELIAPATMRRIARTVIQADRLAAGWVALWVASTEGLAGRPSVREALAELVALKDLKDGLPASGTWQAVDATEAYSDYLRRKPTAWANARAALAAEAEQPC